MIRLNRIQNLNISSNEIKVFTVTEWGTISNHDIIFSCIVFLWFLKG